MITAPLVDVLKRAESWPEDAQEELARVALEIEAEVAAGDYRPTTTELAGIDRGLKAAQEGRFASDEAVEAVFAAFRHK
jgi:hypothetical protein